MNARTRIANTLNFKPVDRVPMIEWADWWDQTIVRWQGEGLPSYLNNSMSIREHFGLDGLCQIWISCRREDCPGPMGHGQGVISDMGSYLKFKKYLFPENPLNERELEAISARQKRGDCGVWITLEGFFWFPRTLFGIEEHLCAFYDQPELMHRINEDLLNYHFRVLDQLFRYVAPEFMTLAEDMSYNKGPMISERLFETFISPYYKRIVPRLKGEGMIVFVDSDGEVEPLIPWILSAGVEGILPIERQAGVDIAGLRRNFPNLRMIGGYDKTVMSKGEDAMRMEFDRLLPVIRQGGYIPCVDHQTPPEVSLDQYRIYLRLLEEYCRKGF